MKAEIDVNGDLILIPETQTEAYAVGERMKDKKPVKLCLQLQYKVEVTKPDVAPDVKVKGPFKP